MANFVVRVRRWSIGDTSWNGVALFTRTWRRLKNTEWRHFQGTLPGLGAQDESIAQAIFAQDQAVRRRNYLISSGAPAAQFRWGAFAKPGMTRCCGISWPSIEFRATQQIAIQSNALNSLRFIVTISQSHWNDPRSKPLRSIY